MKPRQGYGRQRCVICGVATTVEDGCAPICGSSLCESEFDAQVNDAEMQDPPDAPERNILTQSELLANIPKESKD